MCSWIEGQGRVGKILGLTDPGTDLGVDERWEIGNVEHPLSAFFVLPALQVFAYEMATHLGTDVDQPRNLAKSVTVE